MSTRYHINHFYNDGRKIGAFELFQLGRMLGPNQYPYEAHMQHDYYELTLVNRGEGEIYADEKASYVKEGDIYLSLPFEIHKIIYKENVSTDIDFFAFRITDKKLAKTFNSATSSVKLSGNRVYSDRRINNLVGNAIAELEKESEFSETVLKNIFSLIAVYLLRAINKSISATVSDDSNSNQVTCYKIMNYIDTNIFSLKSLSEVSETIGYNYSYASTLFKKTTGKSILDYYYNKRLSVAKTLLDENKFKPVKISEMLNYSSYYSFSRAFKQKYGISPRNYKVNNVEKKEKDFSSPI